MQNVAEAIEEVNLIKITICYSVPDNKKDGPCGICGLDAFQGA